MPAKKTGTTGGKRMGASGTRTPSKTKGGMGSTRSTTGARKSSTKTGSTRTGR